VPVSGGARVDDRRAGLHSQQSFFFPGVLECDPLPLTFWRDEASIRGCTTPSRWRGRCLIRL
jgi:hypothetical protein